MTRNSNTYLSKSKDMQHNPSRFATTLNPAPVTVIGVKEPRQKIIRLQKNNSKMSLKLSASRAWTDVRKKVKKWTQEYDGHGNLAEH